MGRTGVSVAEGCSRFGEQVGRGLVGPGTFLQHRVSDQRKVWVHVIEGDVHFNGERLGAGDGIGMQAHGEIEFSAVTECEFLIFELERTAQ